MDPYTILGVSRTATDAEIKKAYRTLSKKYHPDSNIGNPNQAAYTEKFKQVQNAYQQIMDERSGRSRTQQSYSSYQGGQTYQQSQSYQQSYGGYYQQNTSSYNDIINAINRNDLQTALHLLDQCRNRDDQWFYLSAVVHQRLGNEVTALDHIQQAIRMNPMNLQYQIFYSQLQQGSRQYQSRQQQYGGSMFDVNDYCCKIMMLNMFCNCCCGRGLCC